jgi:uncharacterized heparinase superfamily protein
MAREAKQRSSMSRTASRDVISRFEKAWGESLFYQARLRGPAPDRLLFRPDDPFTPDKAFALSFARGRFALGEEIIDCEGELDRMWELAGGSGAANAFLQEFSWLRHLAALGADGAPIARLLMKGWLDRFEKWSPEAWDPYFTAERLTQLCVHAPLMLSNADALWRSRVLTSMARQTRHLAHAAPRAGTGFERLMTALGLCIAGHCLPGCEGPAARGMEMARRELRLQLRADGGHVSRNPSFQLKLSLRLKTVLKAMEARGFQAPGFLRHTLMRASAMALLFRCPDGRLAVFNGGYEDDGRAVLAVHDAVDPESAPTGFARHSGYHKLATGRALLIADTGDDEGSRGFESAGSMHFSSGRGRIFVNCGNGEHRSKEWRKALSRRAAHSALSFDGPTPAGPAFGAPAHRRAEEAKGLLLEFERPILGMQSENGLYIRRFFLASGGGDLRGEELLAGVSQDVLGAAVWRFHLHPSVKASLARDGRSVILLLSNKEGWRFKSNCAELRLEKSVYCGEGGAPVAGEQIIMRARDLGDCKNDAAAAKWALRRQDAV